MRDSGSSHRGNAFWSGLILLMGMTLMTTPFSVLAAPVDIPVDAYDALPAFRDATATQTNGSQVDTIDWQAVRTNTVQGVQYSAQTTGNVLRSTPTYLRKSLKYLRSPADQNLAMAGPPVRGVVIIAMPRHQNDRAFSNVSLVVGRSLARQLKNALPAATVLNPLQVLEEVDLAEQDIRYNQFLKDYRRTGTPDPTILAPLIATWSQIGQQPIERLVIVEAEVSLNTPAEANRLGDKIRHFLTDDIPTEVQYPLWMRTEVFDCSHWHANPSQNSLGQYGEAARLWSDETTTTITALHDVIATPSIFQDSQNVLMFERAADKAYLKRLPLAPITMTHHALSDALPGNSPETPSQASGGIMPVTPGAKTSAPPSPVAKSSIKQGLSTQAKRLPLSGMEPF